MTIPFPTHVTVDLNAIRHNYCEIRRVVPEAQQIICVIKSNAYGHGIKEVGMALTQAGARYFAVRDLGEGRALRQAGVKAPILLLLGMIEDSYSYLIQYQLTPVIYNLQTARAFNDYLALQQRKHPVHIKIDTGMTRLGVTLDQLPFFLGKLKELQQLQVEGFLSHLADASDEKYTALQKKNWDQANQYLTEAGWDLPLSHLANSVGATKNLFNETALVRAGLILYGCYPDPQLRERIHLKPALSWRTEILDIKSVPTGTPVSYQMTFTTTRPSKIAILPVGYADGYPRLLSNRGHVLICGQKAPILGRVCMDLTMVDITDIADAQIGAPVTLLGTDGALEIQADDLAQWAETISYEIITRIAARVPRIYQDDA